MRKRKYYGMDIGTKKKSSQKSDAEYTKVQDDYTEDWEYWYDLVGIEDVVDRYRKHLEQEKEKQRKEQERRKMEFNKLHLFPLICKLFSRPDSQYYNLLDK